MAMESNDRLPLLSPPALDPTERPPFGSHPPEYYAPQTQNQTQAPRNVRFQSPPTDIPPRNLNDADAESLLPPYSPPAGSYRGHNSEAQYLAALRAWAEEKAFVQPHDKCALLGFYGKETMEECIAKNPELRLGRKKGRKGSKGGKGGEASRGEEAGAGEGVVEDLQRDEGASAEGRRRKSSIGQWLSRKRTG
ncbi:hypothetical protein OEA41_009539 [Lepraria neglecta]|uniref:Uncharacterized protein n=1 Tax=Lepraria neglecta TaxID=209136 RepID=A0AAD9Z608_9LECA|nr:hypothetical protein OEA41_009539 [Lepraria neglecta]